MATSSVCVGMAASCPLFHSLQEKTALQREVEHDEKVSDECSSGVVSVVQEASLCCLCAGDSSSAAAAA